MTSESNNHSIEEFVQRFGFDRCALDLLKSIETNNEKIKDLLVRMYLETPVSAGEEEEVLNYFINNSVFSAATVANPATSVVTEFLYSRPEHPLCIDQYYKDSKSGKAVNSRLLRVEEHIHDLTESYLTKGNVLIGNLGGGPGRDVCNVFSKYYQDNNNVAVINVDRDKMAIKRGKRIAETGGVRDKVKFVETSFMRYTPEKKFDIILLVGVLCGLPPDTCVAVLKNAVQMLAEGGCIMASNVTPKMLQEDPFTYFIMEKIAGWKLVFKSEEVLKEIFKNTGLNWQESFTDDYGFHLMAIGTK